jgi:hypothetical protein
MNGLVELLAADAVVYGDGGTAPSWTRPIVGRDRVARLLAGVGAQGRELGVSLRRTAINGQPGALFCDRSGGLINVVTLDIADGRVQTVRSIVNPDELGHLDPLADVRTLVRERGARRAASGCGAQPRGAPRLRPRASERTMAREWAHRRRTSKRRSSALRPAVRPRRAAASIAWVCPGHFCIRPTV